MRQALDNGNNGSSRNGLNRQLGRKTTGCPTVTPSNALTDSRIVFQTAEGVEMSGAPARVTRHAAIFELFDPGTAPRFSEVLHDSQIILQGHSIYSGRAVVRNVVDAGSKIVCEVTLDETGWKPGAVNRAAHLSGRADHDFANFLKEWQRIRKISPEFKVVISDLLTFLADLQLWLDQLEIAVRGLPLKSRSDVEAEILNKLDPKVTAGIRSINERFEEVLNRVEPDFLALHQAFCRRLLHPLTMCSPFMHRAFCKPLGYAGDYEMVNMMFRDRFEGASLFAKLLNSYALQLPPIVGHQNRIGYLREKLEEESLRLRMQSKDIRIFSMGCGPAQEVQRFLAENEMADSANFTLADFDKETLEYTDRILSDLKSRHARRGSIRTIKRSVQQMLIGAERPATSPQCGQFDLIYCAGLFDYLSDQVCRQLLKIFHGMLSPDGLLIATNVVEHPTKNQMECFLDWHLVYRNEEEIRGIIPQNAGAQNVVVKRDASGVNILVEMRKPESETNGEE